MTFRDATDGQMLSKSKAVTIALHRAYEKGMDEMEMTGIIRRMSREENAREMFFDITEIEVFTN